MVHAFAHPPKANARIRNENCLLKSDNLLQSRRQRTSRYNRMHSSEARACPSETHTPKTATASRAANAWKYRNFNYMQFIYARATRIL